MTLTKGQKYNVAELTLDGWVGNDAIYEQGNRNPGMDGYNVADYFDRDSKYLGADIYGVEPSFVNER